MDIELEDNKQFISNIPRILKNDHLWSFFNIIYTFLGSIFDQCYIQNCVIMNRVIKRLKCINVIWRLEFRLYRVMLNSFHFFQKIPDLVFGLL